MQARQDLLFTPPQLVISREPFSDHDAYIACVRSTGRSRVFLRIPATDGPPTSELDAIAGSSTWLVWTWNPTSSTSITRSVNVQTGKHGPTVQTPFGGVIEPTDGPPPPSRLGVMLNVVVTGDGNYAWTVDGPAAGSAGEVKALYVPDGHGGDRTIDSGAPGSITKLRARGNKIYWVKDGHPMATTLP